LKSKVNFKLLNINRMVIIKSPLFKVIIS